MLFKQHYDPASRVGAVDMATQLTAARTLTPEESGQIFTLNSAVGFAVTLPSPQLGMSFRFYVDTAPTSIGHTIVTASSANIIIGKQFSAAGDAGDTGTTDDTITFVANQALEGDMVDLFSDGVHWYATAFTKIAAGLTFTTAS